MKMIRSVKLIGCFICFLGCTRTNAETSSGTFLDMVGHWSSVQIDGATNGLTNVSFYAYESLRLDTNSGAATVPEEIDGQLWISYRDGHEQALPWSVPIIRLDDVIQVGPVGGRYHCTFDQTNAALYLEDRMGKLFRRIRFQRASPDPGPRRILPESLALRKQLHAKFVGAWSAREWFTNMPEFLGGTNVTLYIYRLGEVFEHRGSESETAYLECEFRGHGRDGKVWMASVARWAFLDADQIRFGISPEAFGLKYRFEGKALVLERKEGLEDFRARFERITRYLNDADRKIPRDRR